MARTLKSDITNPRFLTGVLGGIVVLTLAQKFLKKN